MAQWGRTILAVVMLLLVGNYVVGTLDCDDLAPTSHVHSSGNKCDDLGSNCDVCPCVCHTPATVNHYEIHLPDVEAVETPVHNTSATPITRCTEPPLHPPTLS